MICVAVRLFGCNMAYERQTQTEAEDFSFRENLNNSAKFTKCSGPAYRIIYTTVQTFGDAHQGCI